MASLAFAEQLSEDILREAFQRLQVKLIESLDAGDVIHQLFGAKFLTANDLDDLVTTSSRRQKAEKLLLLMHKLKHPEVFCELRSALLSPENGVKYNYLVDEIDKKYLELNQVKKEVIKPSSQPKPTEESTAHSPPKDIKSKLLEEPTAPATASVTPGEKSIPKVKLVRSLSEENWVTGLTTLNNELYVHYNGWSYIAVYDTERYSIKRLLSVPGFVGGIDMTSCRHYQCLYISDCSGKAVQRIEVKTADKDDQLTKWSVDDQPRGLSVNADYNVIVTCYMVSKIKIFTTYGKFLSVIDLREVVRPYHTIQLTPDQFVVCMGSASGGKSDPLHRVCIVDGNGDIHQSFGSIRGSDENHLNRPDRLAIVNGYIFVADLDNCRVLVLSPALRLITTVLSKVKGSRMCFDKETERFYIDDSKFENGKWTTGHVNVYNVSY